LSALAPLARLGRLAWRRQRPFRPAGFALRPGTVVPRLRARFARAPAQSRRRPAASRRWSPSRLSDLD